MGLIHNFLYLDAGKYSDDIWKKIQYHPLRLGNEPISESDYVNFHDDLLRYFHDYFVWIKLYNPCKKEYVNGFCYYGITTIHDDALSQMKSILYGLLLIFENAPNMVRLKGNFVKDVADNVGNVDRDSGYYEYIYIEKDKIIIFFNKINTLIERAVENKGCILHLGI